MPHHLKCLVACWGRYGSGPAVVIVLTLVLQPLRVRQENTMANLCQINMFYVAVPASPRLVIDALLIETFSMLIKHGSLQVFVWHIHVNV